MNHQMFSLIIILWIFFLNLIVLILQITFFFKLIDNLQMFCWFSLSASSLCLLNCIFNFKKSLTAWIFFDEFNQQHCEIHKLLYKVHEIINVCLNIWKHVESFRHAQILYVNYNFFVHFFSTILLFQNLWNSVQNK